MILTTTILALTSPLAPPLGGDPCEITANLQRHSSLIAARADAVANLALCVNFDDADDQRECLDETRLAFAEELELIEAQHEARLDLCAKLGGGTYDPDIEPANFVGVIDNPYLPWPVGAEWVYESETEEGDLETIVINVLEETRVILGVECVAVRDVVSIDGVPVEDTIDWYAQDLDGNVWYFGEISFNFEDGFVANVEGSWLAGVDGAKPGIVMLGNPVPGVTYRQEWLAGEAEDAGTVLAVDVTVRVGNVTYTNCVETHDFLPPEPDASENKFFAPGIGFIYETKADSDEVVELVSFTL